MALKADDLILQHSKTLDTFVKLTLYLFMDGTFKISSQNVFQVYTQHIVVMKIMIPICMSLLPSKSISTYTRMSNLIQATCLRLWSQPASFFVDFEMAVITSITELFPNSSIYTYVIVFFICPSQRETSSRKEFSLCKRDYNAFNRLVRQATAILLVPPEDVWMLAIEEADHDNLSVMAFCDYTTNTWVDPLVAHFPIEI